MSMIFQSYALWPHMTVAANVAYGLELRKVDRDTIKRKLTRFSRTTHLSALADRYPGELSGGQQQRVALARALIVEPETLLLDEPLSNLDANLREEMRFEVRRLHDEYRYTTVYVTHDQSEAMTTADVIAVMNAGRIEQAGTPEEIYDRPRSEFVARFIGSSNVIKGRRGGRKPPLVRGYCAALHRQQARAGQRRRHLGAPARHPAVGRATAIHGQRGPGDRGTAGISRQQPRLYGCGCRRHAAARGDIARRGRSQGCAGLALSAAGALPGAERLSRRLPFANDVGEKMREETTMRKPDPFQTGPAQGLDRARCVERVRLGHVGRSPGEHSHARN